MFWPVGLLPLQPPRGSLQDEEHVAPRRRRLHRGLPTASRYQTAVHVNNYTDKDTLTRLSRKKKYRLHSKIFSSLGSACRNECSDCCTDGWGRWRLFTGGCLRSSKPLTFFPSFTAQKGRRKPSSFQKKHHSAEVYTANKNDLTAARVF